MSFDQLKYVANICHSKGIHYQYIDEWDTKRQYLSIYLIDIPKLVNDYKLSKQRQYELDPNITLVDQAPSLRLASVCEAASNCLYSMAEISSQFANRISEGKLPSSFNKLRKKFEKGEYKDLAIIDWNIDFQWYKKVRELRTEWSHYSTIYVGQDNERNPILAVKAHRRFSEREEFSGMIQIKISDLITWINNAILTVDNFGSFLLANYVLPSLDLNSELSIPIYDKNGFPKFTDHNPTRIQLEKVSVKEYLARCEKS